MAPMNPARWSGPYQPICWPSQLAKIAPTIPRRVVMINPPGPAMNSLAIAPARNPMMMTHSQYIPPSRLSSPLDKRQSGPFHRLVITRRSRHGLFGEPRGGEIVDFAGAEKRHLVDFDDFARHGDL